MASGVYCISTDVGESSYIVEDLGKVVPINDEHELYFAMKEASNLSVEERSLIGKKSRDKITANFSINAMRNSFSNLYTNIIMEE